MELTPHNRSLGGSAAPWQAGRPTNRTPPHTPASLSRRHFSALLIGALLAIATGGWARVAAIPRRSWCAMRAHFPGRVRKVSPAEFHTPGPWAG